MPMSLNNDEDEIVLFGGANNERDRFSYVEWAEGVTIPTNHTAISGGVP